MAIDRSLLIEDYDQCGNCVWWGFWGSWSGKADILGYCRGGPPQYVTHKYSTYPLVSMLNAGCSLFKQIELEKEQASD